MRANSKGVACTARGVCGKTSDIADLQDLLMHAVRGLAHFANEGRKVGVIDHEIDWFTLKAIFATLTNVNFDENRFQELINECVNRRDQLKEKVKSAGGRRPSLFELVILDPQGSDVARRGTE